jgi:SAM-dependent methyltransferase
MHPSAKYNFELFLKMVPSNKTFLEVGSYNVNGSLRDSVNDYKMYIGLDQSEGPGVDVISKPGDPFPFDNDSFDVVCSSSAFEHDPAFWITFKEMVRVLKTGGLLYVCAPSQGFYHGYPVDCWRFLKDSWMALEKSTPNISLINSYICDIDPVWHDSIGIYRKF